MKLDVHLIIFHKILHLIYSLKTVLLAQHILYCFNKKNLKTITQSIQLILIMFMCVCVVLHLFERVKIKIFCYCFKIIFIN